MLLRQLSEHLRAQNWTATCLELAIVVLGIFLGLQASQWYESRQERQLEESILERLGEDFAAIAVEATAAIEFHQDQIVALGEMQRSLREGEQGADTEAAFLAGLADAMGYHLGPGRSGTYVEILSSGSFRLLRNPELRKVLSEYDDSVQKADYLFSVFQQGQRANESVFNRHFTRGNSKTFDTEALPHGVIYMHGDIVEFDFDAMKADREFIAAIGRLLEYHINYQYWHSGIGRSANRVLASLPARN